MREILHKALTKQGTTKVKVFLFPKDPKNKKKQPVADGCVSFDVNELSKHKQEFELYLQRNHFDSNKEYSWESFLTDGEDVWAKTKDDALFLMAAMQVLNLGEVTKNTEKEEQAIQNGFIQFPMFKVK